ncbi:hypothetical protein [Mesorhizobium sp.]|nr:hypothetical protein [Mesorhizobium sp.]
MAIAPVPRRFDAFEADLAARENSLQKDRHFPVAIAALFGHIGAAIATGK